MTNLHDVRAVSLLPAEFADVQPPVESGSTPLRSQTDLAAPPDWVCLDWSELETFEAVEQHFIDRGVQFHNAIALHPSNPAYPPVTGTAVLLAAPRSGWLEASFAQPVRYVSSYVTSSRRAVLSAFDADNQPLARSETPGANLAGTDADTVPNLELSLHAENIHRITIQAFDGQLTLGEFRFSY
ncbi:MAG: hypothetical protein F6K28_35585 [Microcoleus sp. SIO2G3]|nr:hypothetical protein [Microcoleus sp. SIO2G3]